MTEKEPAPCPFCVSSGPGLEPNSDGYSNVHWVECICCGAQGPIAENEGLAWQAWNRRNDVTFSVRKTS